MEVAEPTRVELAAQVPLFSKTEKRVVEEDSKGREESPTGGSAVPVVVGTAPDAVVAPLKRVV